MKYWYKFTYYECVYCGKTIVNKERMYTEKPNDVNKRHIWLPEFCWDHRL